MKKNIIFCSGGTGGHINPTISAINYFKNESNVVFLTDSRAKKYFTSISCETKILNINPILKRNFFKNFFFVLKFFFSFLYCIFFIVRKKIDIVFGFGGYVSFPVLFAAKLLRKKIYLYEPNLVLGRTNKFFLKSCSNIFIKSNKIINIPYKQKKKFIEVGNIIREEIINFSVIKKKKENEKINIIILGGSQGAKVFGEIIPDTILKLSKNKHKIHVTQQAVKEQLDEIRNFYNKNNISCKLFDFHENIGELISESDIGITRGGASTLAELDFFNVPFVVVPYPYATDNHQYHNALYYKLRGSGTLLEQADFTSNNLLVKLLEILNNKNDIEVKKSKNFNFKKNNTLELIKKEILNY